MIVTVSGRYGCGAVAVAHLAAERLGYLFVDEQLPVVVAKRLGTSREAVESAEDLGASVSERVLRALETGTPEVQGAESASFEQECLLQVQEAVREFGSRGDCVIFGRGASAILGRGSGIVRAFLFAPRDWRMRRVMEGHGVDERTAAEEIDRVDHIRAAYVSAYYSLNWMDPENYDLCLDTSTLGIERSAELLAAAVRPE
jgi:cytidylate kinase